MAAKKGNKPEHIVMKKCLVDASSSILLFKCGLFQRLLETYQVMMADVVFKELTRDGYPGSQEFIQYRAENKMMVLSLPEQSLSNLNGTVVHTQLHKGERDTVFCFREGWANFIVIDDGRAVRYCRANRIPYINALLFPRILYFSGRLSDGIYQQTAAILIAKGRYSQDIIDSALNISKTQLFFFLP